MSFIKVSKIERYPQTAAQVKHRNRENKKAVLILLAVLIIGFAWTRGTFDNFLWRVHLNYTSCGTNAFGATFCGDDLKNYQQRINAVTNP
jgi:hypothetical protein